MNTFILLITVLLTSVMVCSSPVDHQEAEALRPQYVQRRSPQVKDGRPDTKGRPDLSPLYLNVRKGEYVCGNRICKLKPGEIPKVCPRGLCQYPV